SFRRHRIKSRRHQTDGDTTSLRRPRLCAQDRAHLPRRLDTLVPSVQFDAMTNDYRFSFGPWNIHEGADPFGPTVRPTVAFAKKLGVYKELGFDGVQFHDDDAVADIDKKSPEQV